jgi:hypothetical protein
MLIIMNEKDVGLDENCETCVAVSLDLVESKRLTEPKTIQMTIFRFCFSFKMFVKY